MASLQQAAMATGAGPVAGTPLGLAPVDLPGPAPWPPSWANHERPADWPSLSWPPTADQLDYAQKAITVALLVLALPALLTALARRPDATVAGLARRHVA